MAVEDLSERIYTDQTGKFPKKSQQGGQYIMIAYIYNCNAIIAKPLKNKTESELNCAYSEIYQLLEKKGFHPKFHRIDNKLSDDNKKWFKNKGITVEKVPPYNHRRNAAERAIRTFKNHLILGLCTVHPDFPLHHWEDLLPQAEITINLLQQSRIHPHLSA